MEGQRRLTEAECYLEKILRDSAAKGEKSPRAKGAALSLARFIPKAKSRGAAAPTYGGASAKEERGKLYDRFETGTTKVKERLQEVAGGVRRFLSRFASPVMVRLYLPLLAFGLLLGLGLGSLPPTPPPPVVWESGIYGIAPLGRPYRYRGSFNRDFNDLNPLQLEAAQQLGIRPVKSRVDLLSVDRLVPLQASRSLVIDPLTHSTALMVPEAVRLISEVGEAFTGQLAADGEPLYRIIVTSVTRTDEDVADLRGKNANASMRSTHCYGTTLDVSWQRFDKVSEEDPRTIEPDELKHLLARILRTFHDADRCYVKHERQQACFHITVRS